MSQEAIPYPSEEEIAAERDLVMSRKGELPVSPEISRSKSNEETLSKYSVFLSEFEKTEIKSYPSIYYIGITTKIRATKNALENSEFTENKKFVVVPKDHLSYRYKIQWVAGEGGYAEVLRCKDIKTKSYVAVKVLKKNNPYTYQETKMLLYIMSNDIDGTSRCINMLDYDCFRGHHYLVMPAFSSDLGSFLRRGFDITVKNNFEKMMIVAKCVAQALDFLNDHGIIHADLKTDNILININRWSQTKLSDFGLAMFEEEQATYCREYQTLSYRAPEVFCLGPLTPAIDMWSFGCVLAEMVTGNLLLPGRDTPNQFFLIQQVFGQPPDNFFDYCKDTTPYFDRLKYPKHCRLVVGVDGNHLVVRKHEKISEDIKPPGSTPLSELLDGKGSEVFRDFLDRCFKWHPEDRIEPMEALDHDLFVNIDI